MNIFELLKSNNIAAYYTELTAADIPSIGSILFPAKKQMGLDLSWIKGRGGLPVSLMPSSFDAAPTIRQRIGVEQISTDMPFFRESMVVTERDRQALMQAEKLGDAYITSAITKIYDDTTELVRGALVVPERMRMSLLTTGRIQIQPAINKNVPMVYDYNYDVNGDWNNNNVVTLAGNTRWDDTSNSNPIQDIISTVQRAEAEHGVKITRGIMSAGTLNTLLDNNKIKVDLNPTNAQVITISTDEILAYLKRKTGVSFAVHSAHYKDEAGVSHQYFPDGVVSLFPDGNLGYTYFGTTPEEADLMNFPSVDVTIIETGVALCTEITTSPVNTKTRASMIVLPSFEAMDAVQVLNVY